MKKALAVLVIFSLIIGSVFAASYDKLILDSTVKPASPIIGIKTVNSSNASVTGSESGTHVATGKSIANEDITCDVTVYQAGGVNPDDSDETVDYARYKGIVTISLTPFQFYRFNGTTKEEEYVSGAASVESATAKTINGKKVSVAVASNQIKATYTGKVDGNSLELGTFSCKWIKNEELPDGNYQADVKMSYSVE